MCESRCNSGLHQLKSGFSGSGGHSQLILPKAISRNATRSAERERENVKENATENATGREKEKGTGNGTENHQDLMATDMFLLIATATRPLGTVTFLRLWEGIAMFLGHHRRIGSESERGTLICVKYLTRSS